MYDCLDLLFSLVSSHKNQAQQAASASPLQETPCSLLRQGTSLQSMQCRTTILTLLCVTPFAVQGIQVTGGSGLPGNLNDKALQLAYMIKGKGVNITDAKFDLCDDDQFGIFSSADRELGMNFVNGIVLSSGFAADVMGGTSKMGSDAFDHLGYAGLTKLLPADETTKDACALHITFSCQDHEHFGLDFVFGSDNYDCPATDPSKAPTNAYDDVMGIFAQDNLNKAADSNIGVYNDKYISVNTFYSGDDFIDNCDKNINIDMTGYSYPIHIDNTKLLIHTGPRNELWIAVADGYHRSSPNDLNNMKKGSWVFVRRHSLRCMNGAGNTRYLRGSTEEDDDDE